jgi:hypothetical protein
VGLLSGEKIICSSADGTGAGAMVWAVWNWNLEHGGATRILESSQEEGVAYLKLGLAVKM